MNKRSQHRLLGKVLGVCGYVELPRLFVEGSKMTKANRIKSQGLVDGAAAGIRTRVNGLEGRRPKPG